MKSIEAFFRGYILFSVNDKYYLTYCQGLAARKAVSENQEVTFTGLHLFKGWTAFYVRANLKGAK